MNNTNQPQKGNSYDVLLYISDQHTADCAGFMGDPIARTPNLDRIAEDSFVFKNAYTSCPLCVPARASLMTARFASNIGVFDNNCDFRSSDVTFAHSYAACGYDTNLIGRMHFVGLDYFHGFTNRIGKDMTPSYWGIPSGKRAELGDFGRSLSQKHCLEIVGCGDSPVLSYDRDVVSDALEFYSEDHEKPQMTVVGTYSPHFPYVADEEKMSHYREYFTANYSEEVRNFGLSPVDAKVQLTSKEDIIELRSAYYAMVETMDEQIGQVYDAYQEYLRRNGRKGIFIYMSDHGDQLGCMGIYGKQTFFEKSARIPFIIQIPGYEGREIKEPISMIDIAPTLCELNNTDPIPLAEGHSFLPIIKGEKDPDRYAIAEFYDNQISDCIRGYMVFSGGYKYIVYKGFENSEMLFDLNNSRSEVDNIAGAYPEICRELRDILDSDERIKDHSQWYLENKKNHGLLAKVGAKQDYWNIYLYSPPESSRYIDEKCKRPHREW